MPKNALGCYNSIVNQTNVKQTDNFYKYMEEEFKNNNKRRLASIYFTALGRERYTSYKINNDPEKAKQEFSPWIKKQKIQILIIKS